MKTTTTSAINATTASIPSASTVTIASATTIQQLVTAPFTFKKKNTAGEYEPITSTLVDEHFNRLPDNKSFKASCVYIFIHNMYIAATYYTTTKGDKQRKKYEKKLTETIKAWAEFVGIPKNDLIGLYMACGLKKSTSKGVVDSALPSESTFTKSILYVSYTRINSGVWQTKPIKVNDTPDTIKSYDELIELYMNNFGFGLETAKKLADQVEKEKENHEEIKTKIGKVTKE